MPSERFYRLSDAKRQIIRQAAVKEFSRVSFEKVSINQIIQSADISRGSFYTYFEDKNDLLKWVFRDFCEQMREVCKNALQRSSGDYFVMLNDLFEFFIRRTEDTKEIMDMARNVLTYSESAKVLGISGPPSPVQMMDGDSPGRQIYERVDRQRMRLRDYESFAVLNSMAGAALMMAVGQYYEYPEQIGNIRKNFFLALEVLRYGICRTEDEIRAERGE